MSAASASAACPGIGWHVRAALGRAEPFLARLLRAVIYSAARQSSNLQLSSNGCWRNVV